MSRIVIVNRPDVDFLKVFNIRRHDLLRIRRYLRPEPAPQDSHTGPGNLVAALMKKDQPAVQTRLLLELPCSANSIVKGPVVELVVPQDQEDAHELVGLSLEELAVLVVIDQASNVAGEDEILGMGGDFIGCILLVNLQVQVGNNLEGGR
ncbi:hypothetical protein BJX61DRAFT_544655 [Aspergillus egyptiacus]|nr:hypothetical protein BJX61DRAFT_544655 [Aspergillus egyptiacus]